MASTRKSLLNPMMKQRARLADKPMRQLFEEDKNRFKTFSATAGDILLDYSKNRIDQKVMDLLFDIARKADPTLPVRLFIAGHTDTVGGNDKNRKLSLARAKAIASYFRKKGIKIPIAFAGFGEEVLKVKTADNTDERANRRADYVLGPAGGTPPFKGPYLKARASWAQLK